MLIIGEITGAHGVNGEVRVLPLTEHPRRYNQLDSVTIAKGDAQRTVTIAGIRQHKGLFIIRFGEVYTRDQAEQLRGWKLVVPFDQAVPLPPGSYYDFQLIGLEVYDVRDQSLLGTISEVLHLPANAVYRVTSATGKEYLIPALRQVVRQVDIEGKKMHILPLEGLLE